MANPISALERDAGMPSAARAIYPAPHPALDASEKLIVALDFATVGEADAMVELLGETVSFYKIGLHLLFAEGLFDFIPKLIAADKRIFLDFKFIDINDTIEGVIAGAAKARVEFVTVYQSPMAIKAAKGARSPFPNPKILTVTLLTDRDQAYIEKEYNYPGTVSEFVVEKALLVKAAGGDGVICSPQEVCAVRKAVQDPNFLIVTPGIRPAWSTDNGHKRAGTPTEAIGCGANYLVVGRPIIRAANPLEAAHRVIDEMQIALDAIEAN